ncbi:MAG: hypothetical protein ACLT9Y_00155 [Peptostreptococcus anaerobius]|uniref:hypothetical protein n=1 Tax=Peptostreptococcus anaerobius TaxID=1261 RepID=UPI0034A54CD0
MTDYKEFMAVVEHLEELLNGKGKQIGKFELNSHNIKFYLTQEEGSIPFAFYRFEDKTIHVKDAPELRKNFSSNANF